MNRPTARLGDVEFEFEYPILNSSGSGRKAEHEVLPLSENDERTTIIEPIGREPREWKMQGDCYEETANALDGLNGKIIELRHFRFSGDVYVDDVDTSYTQAEDSKGRRYTYTIFLTEIL